MTDYMLVPDQSWLVTFHDVHDVIRTKNVDKWTMVSEAVCMMAVLWSEKPKKRKKNDNDLSSLSQFHLAAPTTSSLFASPCLHLKNALCPIFYSWSPASVGSGYCWTDCVVWTQHYGWLKMLRETIAIWSLLNHMGGASVFEKLSLFFAWTSYLMFLCVYALMCVVVVYEWIEMSLILLCFAWLLLRLMYSVPRGHLSKLQKIMSSTDCAATDRWYCHYKPHTHSFVVKSFTKTMRDNTWHISIICFVLFWMPFLFRLCVSCSYTELIKNHYCFYHLRKCKTKNINEHRTGIYDHISHDLKSSLRLLKFPTQTPVAAPAAEQAPLAACGIILPCPGTWGRSCIKSCRFPVLHRPDPAVSDRCLVPITNSQKGQWALWHFVPQWFIQVGWHHWPHPYADYSRQPVLYRYQGPVPAFALMDLKTLTHPPAKSTRAQDSVTSSRVWGLSG